MDHLPKILVLVLFSEASKLNVGASSWRPSGLYISAPWTALGTLLYAGILLSPSALTEMKTGSARARWPGDVFFCTELLGHFPCVAREDLAIHLSTGLGTD